MVSILEAADITDMALGKRESATLSANVATARNLSLGIGAGIAVLGNRIAGFGIATSIVLAAGTYFLALHFLHPAKRAMQSIPKTSL